MCANSFLDPLNQTNERSENITSTLSIHTTQTERLGTVFFLNFIFGP